MNKHEWGPTEEVDSDAVRICKKCGARQVRQAQAGELIATSVNNGRLVRFHTREHDQWVLETGVSFRCPSGDEEPDDTAPIEDTDVPIEPEIMTVPEHLDKIIKAMSKVRSEYGYAWDHERQILFYDLAFALDLGPIDAAYVAGDVDSLYETAKRGDDLEDEIWRRGELTEVLNAIRERKQKPSWME